MGFKNAPIFDPVFIDFWGPVWEGISAYPRRSYPYPCSVSPLLVLSSLLDPLRAPILMGKRAALALTLARLRLKLASGSRAGTDFDGKSGGDPRACQGLGGMREA